MSDRPIVGKRRFLKLAGMTASVAGTYAKSRLKAAIAKAEDQPNLLALTHRVNGERIAATLGELKGAVMKVGQMASVARDILPPEMAEALTNLQSEAPLSLLRLSQTRSSRNLAPCRRSYFTRLIPSHSPRPL